MHQTRLGWPQWKWWSCRRTRSKPECKSGQSCSRTWTPPPCTYNLWGASVIITWVNHYSRSFLPFAVPDRVPMGIHGVSRKVPERVHGCQTRGLVIKAGGVAVYCSSRLSPTRFLISDLRTPIVYPILIQDFFITTFVQKLIDSLQNSRERNNSAQNLLGKRKLWV